MSGGIRHFAMSAIGGLLSGGILLGSLPGDALALEPDWTEPDRIVRSIELPRIPDRQFDIRDYGAVAGGERDALPAIRQAIDAASTEGGGIVLIPGGRWFVKGPIHLQSRIELRLADDAHLLFSPEPNDYLPVVKQRWEGTEVFSHSPLIYARDVVDVAITGAGTIDGNPDSVFHSWHEKQAGDIRKLRAMGFTGVDVNERVFGDGTYLRPSLIQIFEAERVLLDGYRATNSPFWVNHLVYTDHATVRNLRVDSHFANNDGVDVESSTRVLVENCEFRTGDDSVAIKSGRDLDGRTIGRPSRDIVVRNNDMGGEDGIALGSEMSGGIKNVWFIDNVLREGNAAFRFKSNLDRGGIVEDAYISGADVESFATLFWFQLNYPSEHGGEFATTYRNIVLRDVRARDVGVALFVRAPDELPLQNVFVENVTIESTEQVFDVENLENLHLENVRVGEQVINARMSWRAIDSREQEKASNRISKPEAEEKTI